MEKKELPNNIEGDVKPKASGPSIRISGFSHKIFGIIKFILGICLLPFVYSLTSAFLDEFGLIQSSLQNYFCAGVISLLVIYLFVWEPAVIYAKGHKILELIFNFFKPLVRVAPYVLPIYTILLFIAYELLSLTVKSDWLLEYFIFLLGFSISMHLIFSAKSIRAKKSDFLKANYIFGFALIYIINIMLLSFFLNLIFKEFSFVNFFNTSFQSAKNIFRDVFRQLFSA